MFTDIGLILIMFFAALAWGANESWAMGLISLAAIGLLFIRLIVDAWRGKVQLGRLWSFAPFFLLVFYVGLQRLIKTRTGALPHTIYDNSTALYMLLLSACVSLMLLVATGLRTRTRAKILISCVLALGVFEAVYGLVQYLGGYSFVWDYPVAAGVAHGTFINRNHYALLLNLSMCLGVGFLYYRSLDILRGQNLTFRRVISAPGSAKLAWIMMWLALMGLALVFSMSRMGIFALVGCICVMIVSGKFSQEIKRTRILGSALICIILGMAAYTGLDAVLVRYENITQAVNLEKDRIPIWRDAWRIVPGHLLFGNGLGTFQWLFPAYERIEPDTPAKYAHNDYLQALIEIGVIGLVLVLWAIAASWRAAVRNIRRAKDPLVRGIGLASLGALTAIALQEITDFSLYIPGVAVMTAILLGLNFRAETLGIAGEENSGDKQQI
jgi:putative inorganic carbon (hco3(-)) transporter